MYKNGRIERILFTIYLQKKRRKILDGTALPHYNIGEKNKAPRRMNIDIIESVKAW